MLNPELQWLNDDTVSFFDLDKGGELVNSRGTRIYSCDCSDVRLTSSGDLIKVNEFAVELIRRNGNNWGGGQALHNSADITATSLRGNILVGVHNNQFRVWDLSKPDLPPQVQKAKDNLNSAVPGSIQGCYVTGSKAGETATLAGPDCEPV